MSEDLSHVEFSAKVFDERWPATMSELVAGWIEFQDLSNEDGEGAADEKFFWAFKAADNLCKLEPDLAVDFILALLEENLSPETERMVATGPLEDLLMEHSVRVIDRLEAEAAQNEKLRHALGGIWKYDMPDEVWNRILKIAPHRY
jgi:hypothetical protein